MSSFWHEFWQRKEILNTDCPKKKLYTFRSYSGISRQTHQYSSKKCPVCFETPCRSTWGALGSTVQWPRTILDQLEHHWGLLEPDNHQNTTQNDYFWCISGQICYFKAQNASCTLEELWHSVGQCTSGLGLIYTNLNAYGGPGSLKPPKWLFWGHFGPHFPQFWDF